jgi:hypothetical protein
MISALDVRKWLASRLGRFVAGERAPSTHWRGDWVDPTTGLDAVEKRKILPYRESNPGRPTSSPSLDGLNYPDFWWH